MEVIVRFPSNFVQERSYTLNVLFRYFENIDLVLLPEKRIDYEISLMNTSIIINDFFWKDLSEQSINNLWELKPSPPQKLDIPKLGLSIISTYGENSFTEKDNYFHLKSDIIASTFFFLTRWEEWISDKRDKHDRFPDTENYLIKHELYRLPVVNEYIEFLRILLSNGITGSLNYNRSYTPYVTHDVDEIYRFKPLSKWAKSIAGDFILRKDPLLALKTFVKGVITQFQSKRDDSQTFEYFMDISEKYNLKSHFYFIPGKQGETDFRYSIDSKPVRQLIKNILDRQHILGIHPSYRSKDKPEYFEQEVKRLRQISKENVEEGRHHYLRMNYPTSLKEWENNRLKLDSSLGFHDHAGFRAGICYEFPVFDLDDRKQLNLIERPLIAMEVALQRNTTSIEEFKQQIDELAKVIRKYNGDFVILWHNNNIHHPAWKKLGKHYEEIIKIIAK